MSTYDFSKLMQDAKAGGAWPVGDYDFEIADATAAKASTGSDMIKTKLRCLVGPYANKQITNNFVLSPDSAGALAIFFRHMKAFGLDDTFFKSVGTADLEPIARALVGRRARIQIKHREWNGAMQNDVATIKPLTDGVGVVHSTQSTVPPPPPGAPAAPAPAAPPPPPQDSTITPPPPPAPSPAPAPPPPPAPPSTPTPAPVVEAGESPNGAPPAGYTQELWDNIPDVAKQAILASAAATVTPPPPPSLPV
jgi:hypothetical protein